jgi:hypothetical protein
VLWQLGNYSEAAALLKSIPHQASQQSDIALGIDMVRATMLLSQRRFSEAIAIATHLRQHLNDLTPSDQMDVGYVITVANLEVGHVTRGTAGKS